jgi:predicted oxidoreductase
MIDSGVERQYRLTGVENEPDFNGRQQSRILVNGRKTEPATPKIEDSICCKGRNFTRRMTLVKE